MTLAVATLKATRPASRSRRPGPGVADPGRSAQVSQLARGPPGGLAAPEKPTSPTTSTAKDARAASAPWPVRWVRRDSSIHAAASDGTEREGDEVGPGVDVGEHGDDRDDDRGRDVRRHPSPRPGRGAHEVADPEADEHDREPGHGRPPSRCMDSSATPMPSRRTRCETADALTPSRSARSCCVCPRISPPRISREVVDIDPTMKSRQSSADCTAATVPGASSGPSVCRPRRARLRLARALLGRGDRVAGRPVRRAVVDAPHRVEGRDRASAEPEADVGAGVQGGAHDEAGVRACPSVA